MELRAGQAVLADVDIGRRFVMQGVAYMQTGESDDCGATIMAFVLTGKYAYTVERIVADTVVELVQEEGAAAWKSQSCIRWLWSWWQRVARGWWR